MDDHKKKEILAKVEAQKPLTKQEDLWYMVEIMGLSKEEAERIITINSNKNKNLIID